MRLGIRTLMKSQKEEAMKRWFIGMMCLIPFANLSAATPENDTTQQLKVDTTVLLIDNPFVSMLDSMALAPYFEFFALETDTSVLNTYGFEADSIPMHDDAFFREKLMELDMQTPFNLVYNDRVKAFINLYAVKRREQTAKLLGLQNFYFPMIEEVLDQYQMPYELKYLAVIESALNPKARSKAGAVGMWQFMYSTGKIYGLHMNSYMDERMDPVKSTEAACKYLSFLYNIYGKWDLALAAYNCGPGNVNRAMRRSGSKDGNYWDLYPYLPRETRGYVPAFIAVNYVMSFPEAHNIYPVEPRISFFETDTVHVCKPMDLKYIAENMDVSLEDLRFLNPSYSQNFIPAYSNKTSILRLPRTDLGVFYQNEDHIYVMANPEKENDGTTIKAFQEDRIVYRVRSGDYLGKIASRYHVSVSSLRRWNGLRNNNIRVGQRLVIYPSGNHVATKSAPEKPKPIQTTQSGNYLYYEIQSGDTLWDIAKAKGISVDELKRLNRNINYNNMKPGTKIIVGTNG